MSSGMEYDSPIEEHEILEGLNLDFFTYTKLWGILNHYRGKRERSWNLYIGTVISLIIVVPFVTLNLLFFFYVHVDLRTGSLVILNPLTCAQSLTKLAIFWLYIDKQSSLMNLYKKDFLPSITPEKRAQARHIYNKFIRQTNFFCTFITCINSFVVIFWNFLPMVRSKVVGDFLNVKLQPANGVNKVLGGWYPFSYGESPWYEGVFIYELMVCTWVGVLINLYETLVISLIMMLGTHIAVLGYVISQVTEDTSRNKQDRIDLSESDRNDSKGLSSQEQLLLYLRDHQMLMKFGDEFKDMYNLLITLQLGLGLLVMIISIFHFNFDSKDTFDTLKFLVYLTYQVLEIVLYCYGGTFLETTSTDISFHVYNCDWFNRNINFRKTCRMLMIRTRTPVTLKAARIYPVNSITLASMMQLTYSSSALLSKITDE